VADTCARRSSVAIHVDDGIGEGLGCFLWQVVPDAAGDDPMRIIAREFLA
jgi:hypothetical protein